MPTLLAALVVVLLYASAVLAQAVPLASPSGRDPTTTLICPQPLLLRPANVVLDSAFEDMFCQDNCCVPCPAHFYLFPSFRWGFIGVYIVQSIGFLLTAFIFLSYAIRRGDKFPTNLIKWGSLAIMLDFSCALLAFDPKRGPEALWCANATTSSSNSNNLRCAIQGFMVVFTTHCLSIWVVILIVNTHFKIVWNKSTQRFVPLMHVLAWGVPTVFAITATVLKAIKIETTPFCTIGRENSNGLLLAPLMFYMVPSTIMHAITLFQMVRITYKVRKLLYSHVEIATIRSDEEAEEVRAQSVMLQNEQKRGQEGSVRYPAYHRGHQDHHEYNMKRSNSDKSIWTLPQLQGAVWLHLIQTNWRFLIIGFNFCVTIVFSSIAVTQFNKYFAALTPYLKGDWIPCLIDNFPTYNDIQMTVNSCRSVIDNVAGGSPSQVALLGQEYLLTTIPFWFFAIFYRHQETKKAWADLFKSVKIRFFPRSAL